MPSDTDSLAALRDRIATWASSLGVPVLQGSIEETGGLPVVDFDPVTDDASALDPLSELSPKLLTLHAPELTEDRYRTALAELTGMDVDDTTLSEARACKRHIGLVGSVCARVLTAEPPAVISFERFADWYGLMFDHSDLALAAEQVREAAELSQAELLRKSWGPDRMSALARRAASDLQFPRCKTEAARLVVIRRLLGDDLPAQPFILKEIAREAHAVYELDIRTNSK